MTTADPFRFDDAAYVLGALSGHERAAFEAHLAECAECADRVREVSAAPSLLGDLTAADLDQPVDVPDTLLPSLLRAARRDRRRRVWLTAAGAAVAAVTIAALSVTVATSSTSSTQPAARPVAMTAVVPSPVHAEAAVASRPWGTSVTLDCHYDSTYHSGVAYSLLVVDRSGTVHDAGSWTLVPGRTTHFTGGTDVPRDRIAKVEIALPDRTPILTLPL